MTTRHRGSIMLLVLVFGAIFFVILGGLIQLVLVESRAQEALIGKAQSFSIAEAGLEYYAWFLTRFPDDYQNGTGSSGPYVINYADPETGTTGTYTLEVEGASACNSTQMVDITSTGVSNAYPNMLTTLVGRYGAATVAQYPVIVDDGTYGIDFASLLPDFAALKAIAQAQGIFLPQHEVPQDPHLGYHLIFNTDGTLTVNLVTAVTTLRTVEPVDRPGHYINDFTLIRTEEFFATFPIPSDCGLIYSEDNTWIEGVIPSKITLAVSTLGGAGAAPDVILLDDLTYASMDGSDGLTVLGEHNIVIAPDSPQDLTIHGIFVAVEGYFGRNNYYVPSGGCGGLYEARDELELVGTIVSEYAPRVTWPNGCGAGNAGYQTFSHQADPGNATNPPPYTPRTSTTHSFIDWQQTR